MLNIVLSVSHLSPKRVVRESVIDGQRRQLHLIPRVHGGRRHARAPLFFHLVEAGLDGIVELVIREGGVRALLVTTN